ncbi:MAG: radical SAM protein [Deltaproteobacteria bacterium]|nr:radical SAM protein [Deltaproteobacteria bacterium]
MDFEPAYLRLWQSGALEARVERALGELAACRLCPRNCGVDRLAGNNGRGATGACLTGRRAMVASAFAHQGEERPLRGRRGSGTIFFAGCNLRCVFCQNWDISQQKTGREAGPEELATLMLALQEAGCHNINFVTPEHVVPQIIEALPLAISAGLRVPLVYNTSAYDSAASLELMDGLVDIYMPDFKLWDPEKCFQYLKARDYPGTARTAIAEMHRQVGDLRLDAEGLARRGLLLRHLIMPEAQEDTRAILHWIAANLSRSTYINLMDQYRPQHLVGHPRHMAGRPENKPASGRPALQYAAINRCPSREELQAAFAAAQAEGLRRLDEPLPD